MAEAIKYFLAGVGSVLELMPPSPTNVVGRPDFMRVSDETKIRSDWQRVGKHLERAIVNAKREMAIDGSAK